VNAPIAERARAVAAKGWDQRGRFVKFGVVGASGVLVNLATLWLARDHLLEAVSPEWLRLNGAIAVAILVSTLSNFHWNRRWTWVDRRTERRVPVVVQFGQYALACWIGIALQFLLTNLFAIWLHYLLAAFLAIGIASLFNFTANDAWTFRTRKAAGDAA
jgi:dolichol-phosphate mannosyltransferase